MISAQQEKIDALTETMQALAEAQASSTKTANGLVNGLECASKQLHLGRQNIQEQSTPHVSETVKLEMAKRNKNNGYSK